MLDLDRVGTTALTRKCFSNCALQRVLNISMKRLKVRVFQDLVNASTHEAFVSEDPLYNITRARSMPQRMMANAFTSSLKPEANRPHNNVHSNDHSTRCTDQRKLKFEQLFDDQRCADGFLI